MGHDGTCNVNGDSCAAHVAGNDQVNLMQLRTQVRYKSRGSSRTYRYGPQNVSRSALDYFKHWSLGKVVNHMRRHREKSQLAFHNASLEASQLAFAQRITTSAGLVHFLQMHRLRRCPEIAKSLHSTQYSLHDSSVGPPTVEHFVLRSSTGGLQYIAKHEDHIVSAYPEVCDPSVMLQTTRNDRHVALHQDPDDKVAVASLGGIGDKVPGQDSIGAGGRKIEPPKASGTPTSLDPGSDQLVKDCAKLFHRTAKDMCGKDFDMVTKAAVEKVIDGLAVEMSVVVDKSMYHDIACEFEVSAENEDAKLVQRGPPVKTEPADGSGPTLKEQLPEEKKGLVATLVMETDLCNADEVSTMSAEDKTFFLSAISMGELSRYKGFEHVNDDLPVITESVLMQRSEAVPAEIDLRKKYPKCYTDSFKEPVRDQGQCGSCWAFAAASATMNNLCGSGDGSYQVMKDDSDRFEVSVQQIMSCNSEKVGCNGGYASAANDAMKKKGITQERVSPYQCGGGDPLNHFDAHSDSCKKSPWGGTCDEGKSKYAGWNWGGAFRLDGEEAMASCIADGYSLYSSLDVYGNFMSLKDEIYSSTTGAKKGGHALVTVGYGKEGDTKYWILQNSWGTSWGVNGYGRMLKGANLAGIEEQSYYMRAWTSEAKKKPPCFDSSGPDGSGWIGFSCAKVPKAWCSDPPTGANCPLRCGTCPGGVSGPAGDPLVPPTPATPATPAPTPPPAPTGCEDSDTFKDPYFGDTCKSWKGFQCTGHSFSDELVKYCPRACKTCTPAAPEGCQDSHDYTDPVYGDSCAQWSRYICTGYSMSAELVAACPLACKTPKCKEWWML